jgi:hypothetical protein
MKRISIALLLAIAVLTTGLVSTTNAKGPSIYRDCGIGAMIFSGEEEWNRSVASLINIIWDWGTTASSSKSSGTCTRQGNEVAAAIFIHETLESVVEDTAKGNGDHLTAVLDLMEVSSESRSGVVSTLQAELSEAVSAADYSSMTRLEKAETYYGILESAI